MDDVSLIRQLRNALTVIKGRAQRLRRQALASGHPDRGLLRELDEIDRAVDRLVRLLDRQLPAGTSAGGETPDDETP